MIRALILITLFLFSTAASAEPLCVSKNKVKLRKGPGMKFGVSWEVGKNMPLMKIGAKGKWFEVQDFEGHKHWVQSSAVSRKFFCAVVKSKVAKLRKGPGTEFPMAELQKADRYTPFKKVDRDGAWLLLQDTYKAQYWVHETNLWIPMNRSSLTF